MKLRHLSLHTGGRHLAMPLALALALVATLLVLGWRLLRQDREMVRQALAEKQENAADVVVASFSGALLQAEARLSGVAANPAQAARDAATLPADALIVVRQGGRIKDFPEDRLAFYPGLPSAATPADPVLRQAEALEFQRADYQQAIELLRAHQANSAAALLGIARMLRKQGRWQDALAAYQRMLTLDNAFVVDGVPAVLLARHARMRVFEERSAPRLAREEAAALATLLAAGKWRLQRGAYEFLYSDLRRILGTAPDSHREALSAAYASFWDAWNADHPDSGRRLISDSGRAHIAIWRVSRDVSATMLLGPGWAETVLRDAPLPPGMRVTLTDGHGNVLLGQPVHRDLIHPSVRLASASGLPWNIHVMAAQTMTDQSFEWRQRLLIAVLAAVSLLMFAGVYLIARAITRELAVSRLQSDFVSAVSHEFRTPLTTLCLLSGQLAEGKIANPKDQNEYFGALSRESQRLRRLVEGLLNFGRMEAGAARYRFETLDPAELAAQVSEEFREEGLPHAVSVLVKQDAPLVSADRAALACVIWNLLDNAAKYSAPASPIEVIVERAGTRAAIRVRDRGQGIAAAEQRRIFQKFVRGESAIQAGIRGTGIGLAMVRFIAAAHDGEIQLESEPGKGSTFSLLLPIGNGHVENPGDRR